MFSRKISNTSNYDNRNPLNTISIGVDLLKDSGSIENDTINILKISTDNISNILFPHNKPMEILAWDQTVKILY